MEKAGKIAGAALIALMVAGSGAVLARGEGRGHEFSALDTDGDGQITQAEIQAMADARFSSLDTDDDGTLSLEELIKGASERVAERAEKMIKRFDSNADGKLSADEMPRRGGDREGKMFKRADADGNGSISQEEFDAMREARMERRSKHYHGKDRN